MPKFPMTRASFILSTSQLLFISEEQTGLPLWKLSHSFGNPWDFNFTKQLNLMKGTCTPTQRNVLNITKNVFAVLFLAGVQKPNTHFLRDYNAKLSCK